MRSTTVCCKTDPASEGRPTATPRPKVVLSRAQSRQEWDDALAPATGVTPFHSWDWLQWVSPLLHCRFLPWVVTDLAGRPAGVAPLLLKRRGPLQTANWVPFPYVGPLVAPDLLGPTLQAMRRAGRRQRLVDLQITVPPLAPGATEAFTQSTGPGFRWHLDETYIITLSGRDLAEVKGGMNRAVQQKLRRLTRRGIELRPSTSEETAGLLPRIVTGALARHGLRWPYAANFGDELAARPPRVPLHITSAVLDGTTVGVLATLGGATSATWMGGVLDEHRGSNAAVALYWEAIAWAHANRSDHLDLVGVPTPGIANFKRQFGGELYVYPVGQQGVALYQHLRHGQRIRQPGSR